MGKTINKMNKKELIEKIKQLEEEKEEYSKKLCLGEYKYDVLSSFIKALNLWSHFIKMVKEEEEVSLSSIKESVNKIGCPECECEYGCDMDKQIVKLQLN